MAFNVEVALIAWLPGKVGAPAYAQVPDPRPESFLTVERTGGISTIGVDYPTVAVRAWAGNAYEASELAISVRDAMLLEAVEIPQVRHVDVGSGPYSSPDSDSRQQAYQTVFNMVTEQ